MMGGILGHGWTQGNHSVRFSRLENPDSESSMSGMLKRIHHAAIIASDYEVSKRFYTGCLGLRVVAETYRAERQSHKLDLALPDGSQIELFTFPAAPLRLDSPEALGLRHLAFAVEDVAECKAALEGMGIPVEPIRVDELTGREFTFFKDPDGLPLELYQD